MANLNVKPSLKQVGHTTVKITDKQFNNWKTLWRTRSGKISKTALLLKAISEHPLLQTNELRRLVDCSNVPDLVRSINKKIMNKGYMVIRVAPANLAPNDDFHFWCLVEAPIMDISVKMAVNDPVLDI